MTKLWIDLAAQNPKSKFPVLVFQNEKASKLLGLLKSCILTFVHSSFLLSLSEMPSLSYSALHVTQVSGKQKNVFAAETVNKFCSTEIKMESTPDID